jgi:uncharacterized membrane protein YdbT with pleckstrin-like domain
VPRLIRQSRLFKNLSDEDFQAVVRLMKADVIPVGAVLYRQADADESLYIVRRGKALVRQVLPNKHDPIMGYAGPGDFLNEMSFVTGRLCMETVEVIGHRDLEAWRLPRPEFQALLASRPSIKAHLGYPDEARLYLEQKKRFPDQRDGELVRWYSRKYPLVIITSSWLAWLLLIGIGVMLIPTFRPFTEPFLLRYIAPVMLIVAMGILLWNIIDWLNDYYAVTDQRVIHHERVILLYVQQDESPVARVQNVTVNRKNLIANLLDVGDVFVELIGSASNINMDWVKNPDKVTKTILDEQARARAQTDTTERSKIREDLRQEMFRDPMYVPPPEKKKDAPKPRQPFGKTLAMSTRNTWNEVFPRMRHVRGKDIIYRKHWLYLLISLIPPTFFLLLYIFALVYISRYSAGLSDFLFRSPMVVGTIALGLIIAFWWVWRYEDWRNDLFILKPDQVIDYKRSPFGIQGTKQRTAGLIAVQNVTATTKGFVDVIFNIGDVVILTGGTINELIFSRVSNPRGIQREIVDRMFAVQNAAKERDAAVRRREIAEWIGIYDELTRMHERPRLG